MKLPSQKQGKFDRFLSAKSLGESPYLWLWFIVVKCLFVLYKLPVGKWGVCQRNVGRTLDQLGSFQPCYLLENVKDHTV